MGQQLKPVGQAVATGKGHYPLADGRHRTVMPGETFVVFEGLEKGKWFTLQQAGVSAPAARVAPPVEPDTLSAVAATERKRKAAVKAPTADPSADEIA